MSDLPPNWTLIWLAVIPAFSALGLGVIGLFKVFQTHSLVNSRMTELLELTRKSSKAEGVKEQKESQ